MEEITTPLAESTASPTCPRCQIGLVALPIEEPTSPIQALSCPHCQGSFLKQIDLRILEETVRPTWAEFRRLPSSEEQQAPLRCPTCRPSPEMEKLQHHRDSHVTIDHCPQCRGAWLDAGELRAIQEESLPVFLLNTVKYIRELLK